MCKELCKAYYIETYNGYDYFRDKFGNIYCKIEQDICFCSNLKSGRLTEDKAEPYYKVKNIELVKGE